MKFLNGFIFGINLVFISLNIAESIIRDNWFAAGGWFVALLWMLAFYFSKRDEE